MGDNLREWIRDLELAVAALARAKVHRPTVSYSSDESDAIDRIVRRSLTHIPRVFAHPDCLAFLERERQWVRERASQRVFDDARVESVYGSRVDKHGNALKVGDKAEWSVGNAGRITHLYPGLNSDAWCAILDVDGKIGCVGVLCSMLELIPDSEPASESPDVVSRVVEAACQVIDEECDKRWDAAGSVFAAQLKDKLRQVLGCSEKKAGSSPKDKNGVLIEKGGACLCDGASGVVKQDSSAIP